MHLFCTSLVLCVLSACHMITSTCDGLLTSEDAEFCKGELKLIYPDLVIDKCLIIPQRIREKISKEWGSPQVQLPSADEEKKYTLLMVDPDAPSRKKPSRAYWRHWLLADIKGEELKTGDVRGIELSAYTRPTPPQGTGLHRYQFLVFEQPEGQTMSLSPQEKSSLGCGALCCVHGRGFPSHHYSISASAACLSLHADSGRNFNFKWECGYCRNWRSDIVIAAGVTSGIYLVVLPKRSLSCCHLQHCDRLCVLFRDETLAVIHSPPRP